MKIAISIQWFCKKYFSSMISGFWRMKMVAVMSVTSNKIRSLPKRLFVVLLLKCLKNFSYLWYSFIWFSSRFFQHKNVIFPLKEPLYIYSKALNLQSHFFTVLPIIIIMATCFWVHLSDRVAICPCSRCLFRYIYISITPTGPTCAYTATMLKEI